MNQIVYIDSECILCNRLAIYILKNDKNEQIIISSLQKKHSKESLLPLIDLNTVIYQRGQKTLEKSNAILWILYDLGGIHKFSLLCFLFPKFIRDFVYDIVANNRKNFFTSNKCELPQKEWKNRIDF